MKRAQLAAQAAARKRPVGKVCPAQNGACSGTIPPLNPAAMIWRKMAVLLLAWSALHGAHAEVFIYRGTIKATTDFEANNFTLARAGYYLVVDYATRKIVDIPYGKIATGKVYVAGAAPVTVAMLTAPVSATAAETVITNAGLVATTLDDFNLGAFFIKGKNTSFVTAEVPITTRATRPRALKGTAFTALSTTGGTPRFSQKTFAVALHSKATVSANNDGKTIDEVAADLIAQLEAQGYAPFTPAPGR